MKKLLVIATTCAALTGIAAADIQASPGSTYTSARKLGRAIDNIFYGFMEIPEQMVRKNDLYGRKALGYGVADGTSRALRRLGYGFYELFTFNCPTYRGTFKPPYESCGSDNRIQMNPHDGLSEFPPELGADGGWTHTRQQGY
ncbi:MAG: exosortase system-associated protein, TIGR04073 family [Verrucomicrobiota bacterium]